MEATMAGKEISVKRYVVKLSVEEREHLEGLLRKGKSAARRQLKARILLKADVSGAGEGWSDSRIVKALENKVVELGIVERASDSTIGRTLKKTLSSRIAGSAG